MGTVLTVMNMKGGVGKTTTALHLAGLFSRYAVRGNVPRKILAIDYDPQFNLSQAFMASKAYFEHEKKKKTTLSILVDDEDDLDPFVLQVPGSHTPPKVENLVANIYQNKEAGGKLDLVPSTMDLMYVALGQANKNVAPIIERFDKFIADARSKYDIVIIDCHPAGSIFTQTSLSNSDHVVIPVTPQRYAVRGVGLMLDFIKAKQVAGKAVIPHILFNMVPRTGVHEQEAAIRQDKKFTAFCMKNTLKKYGAFAEPEGGAGYVWLSKKSYSTEAFGNLIAVGRELLARIEG